MRLLALLVFMLAMPVSALANGTPCGVPPQLENAEAQQTITTTVREDLGAAPVEAPFLDRARRSVDELADRFGLPRAAVVDLYLFHICEALYVRGTGPDRLGQVMSRVKQALNRSAEPDKEAAAGAEEKSASPGAMGGHAPMTDDALDAPTTQALGTAEVENEAAPTSQEQAAETDTAVTRESAETDTAASREGAETDGVDSREGAALGADDESAPSDASSEDNNVMGVSRSRSTQSTEPESSGNTVINQQAAPKSQDQVDVAMPAPSAGTNFSEDAASKPQGQQGSAQERAARRPEPQQKSFRFAPQRPENGGSFNQFSVPLANRLARTPDDDGQQHTGTATASRGNSGAATRAPATARPQAPSGEAPSVAPAPRALAKRARPSERRKPANSTRVTEPKAAAPEPQAEATRSATRDETAGESATPEAAPSEPEEIAEAAVETAADSDGAVTAARSATPQAAPEAARRPCPERGVLGPECLDVDKALERLSDRPVEYNHPPEMIKGQATEISLVLRTDFTAEGMPEDVSEAFENLQGEVQQQRAKIANVMSARLRGRDFQVDPSGMQERTVTWRRPVQWSWYVTPKAGGENKRLKLELYAHIVNPQGQRQPPVLIKTLDATIDVDVRTLDWLIEQARTFEPIYAVAAAFIGLFTALVTVWMRRRPTYPGDAGPPSGITATQTPSDRRVSDMSAGEAAAAAARKGQDEDDSGGPPGNGHA